ncbi:hypothetical protein ACFXAF_32305, partial [Kitasatospora sp. NPDC059463]
GGAPRGPRNWLPVPRSDIGHPPPGGRRRPAAGGAVAQAGLPAVPERRTLDLTTEEATAPLPRLDSLEQKLKDLEQQFG